MPAPEDDEYDHCWTCSQPEECPCEDLDGCYRCGGSGEFIPDHCCVCGGSPYCQCCGKCGSPSVGRCDCPIPVPLSDGTTTTV